MDLLARYLQAVRFFLPRRQQDDIVRELSENLAAVIEEREAELGRALREDELAELLRRHGHPVAVAGRYRERQYLIGPVVFPIYVATLNLGLLAALAVTLLETGGAAVLSDDPVRRVVTGFLSYPGRALMVFAWTTLGFALFEYMQARVKLRGGWDPHTLPPLVRVEHRISRTGAAFELLVSAGALVWLLLVALYPSLAAGRASEYLIPTAVWGVVYVPMLAILLASATVSVIDLLRPYWTSTRAGARIAIDIGALAIIVFLLRAGDPWLVLRQGAVLPSGVNVEQVLTGLNGGIRIGLLVAALMCLIEIGRQVVRHWWRPAPAADDAGPARATR